MARQREKEHSLPEFKSLEEEAAFWDIHSPLDYPGEWIEAEDVEVIEPLGHILAVRLDAALLQRLGVAARERGVEPSTLARAWILERLTEWEDRKHG